MLVHTVITVRYVRWMSRNISENTLAKNHLNVPFARKDFHRRVIYRFIYAAMLIWDHINVRSVQLHARNVVSWTSTWGFIWETNHLSVAYVSTPVAPAMHWRNTHGYTLVNDHTTAQFASKHSDGSQRYWNTSNVTLVSNPMLVISVITALIDDGNCLNISCVILRMENTHVPSATKTLPRNHCWHVTHWLINQESHSCADHVTSSVRTGQISLNMSKCTIPQITSAHFVVELIAIN